MGPCSNLADLVLYPDDGAIVAGESLTRNDLDLTDLLTEMPFNLSYRQAVSPKPYRPWRTIRMAQSSQKTAALRDATGAERMMRLLSVAR